MTKLFSFKKVSKLNEPLITLNYGLPNQGHYYEELCTLSDGRTIAVTFVDDALIIEQPEEIKASIEYLPDPLPDELRKEICAASYVINYIDKCTQDKIAERYSMADEIKLLRTKNKEKLKEYNRYVEECIAEGKAKKAVYTL
jgi:hypothetical protein